MPECPPACYIPAVRDIEPFLERVVAWAEGEEAILGVVLVGSFAHGGAHDGSDVDLVILTTGRERYLGADAWLSEFGAGEPESMRNEDWGAVQARRAFYADGLEAEFNFAAPSWGSTDPIDPGTRRVMADGHRILLDKAGLLAKLTTALE